MKTKKVFFYPQKRPICHGIL